VDAQALQLGLAVVEEEVVAVSLRRLLQPRIGLDHRNSELRANLVQSVQRGLSRGRQVRDRRLSHPLQVLLGIDLEDQEVQVVEVEVERL